MFSNNHLHKNQKQSHNVVHERKKPHKCSICDYRFTTEGNLNSHIDTNHEGFIDYGFDNYGSINYGI